MRKLLSVLAVSAVVAAAALLASCASEWRRHASMAECCEHAHAAGQQCAEPCCQKAMAENHACTHCVEARCGMDQCSQSAHCGSASQTCVPGECKDCKNPAECKAAHQCQNSSECAGKCEGGKASCPAAGTTNASAGHDADPAGTGQCPMKAASGHCTGSVQN